MAVVNQKNLCSRGQLCGVPRSNGGYDRNGALEETFQNFTIKAKCGTLEGLDCLRKASAEDLRKANQEVVSAAIDLGMFPFGPAVDGDLVPELPAALLSKGQHNKCSSIIVSHDYDEASMFLAEWVDTKEDFTQFLAHAFPGTKLADIRQRIEQQYPAKFFDFQQKMRMKSVLRDSTFVCNKRQIYNAFHNDSRVYTARFNMPPAEHGFDMFAIIWHRYVAVGDLIKSAVPKIPDHVLTFVNHIWPAFGPKYQAYFADHAMSGDPNLSHRNKLVWEPAVDNGNELTNSLIIGMYMGTDHPFFMSYEDSFSSTENCAFWDDVANEISKILGHESASLVSFRTQMELR